jgi:hypothetical protein
MNWYGNFKKSEYRMYNDRSGFLPHCRAEQGITCSVTKSEFLITDQEVSGSIPGAIRFSE